MIGDDDQSIYKFKFAHPEGIIEYPQRMPHVLKLATEECRRCLPTRCRHGECADDPPD